VSGVPEVSGLPLTAGKRYVERLPGRSFTDPASIPNDNIEALFQFS